MLTFYKIYGGVFTKPNPPARVTVACGDILPLGHNIIIHLNLFSEQIRKFERRGLHVQSRSYWAPANIGPYSQAKSLSLSTEPVDSFALFLVHVAGQIPLVPNTMALPTDQEKPTIEVPMHSIDTRAYQKLIPHEYSYFITQTALSLQHLWRIGSATDVISWTAAVAYLSRDSPSKIAIKAKLAGTAWEHAHRGDYSEDHDSAQSELIDGDRDLWEERYNRAYVHKEYKKNSAKILPDWSIVSGDIWFAPPFFAAEVEELPRGSDIEWHALLGVTKGPIVVIRSYLPLRARLTLTEMLRLANRPLQK
jgi:diphthine-ammonia ligase